MRVTAFLRLALPAANPFRNSIFLSESRYRFGSCAVRLCTDDVEFGTRFARIFHDCMEPGVGESAIRGDTAPLTLEVCSFNATAPVVAKITGHGSNSAGTGFAALFPDLNLVTAQCDVAEGWQLLARVGDPDHALIAMVGNTIMLDRELPWQMLVAHYFLDQVMRMQPEFAFFHAATVAIGDRGVFLSGNKGAGKSTLSLALAARGHGFLGDELGTIHSITGTMLPFRRAVSIRLGPQAQAVQEYLLRNQVEREILPDGTERLRMPASQIFPAATGRSVALTHAFFLQGVAKRPEVNEFEFCWRDLPLLAPLHATLENMPAAVRTMRFLRLFAKVRCFILCPGGTPDETAELIEGIVESKWGTTSNKERSMSAPFAG